MLMLTAAFQPGLLPTDDDDAPIQWFIFANGNLLVRPIADRVELPVASIWPFAKLPAQRRLYLGTLYGQPCHAAEVAIIVPPPGLKFESLRALWQRLDEGLLGVASYAAQLIEWDRSHQFCGCCGGPTERRADERARDCAVCGAKAYPQLSPVVMVRVVRDGQILLARAPRFAAGVYSVLAGFVEAGETLEQAIHREVLEEVNIRVTNLRYIASQSWPFPHSLMVAFTADYAGGELHADGQEIIDAGWFAPGALPGLPSPMSMAWRLIQGFVSGTE